MSKSKRNCPRNSLNHSCIFCCLSPCSTFYLLLYTKGNRKLQLELLWQTNAVLVRLLVENSSTAPTAERVNKLEGDRKIIEPVIWNLENMCAGMRLNNCLLSLSRRSGWSTGISDYWLQWLNFEQTEQDPVFKHLTECNSSHFYKIRFSIHSTCLGIYNEVAK